MQFDPQVIPTRGGVGKTLEQRSGPTFAVGLATANIQSIPLPCAGSKIKGRLSKSAALGFRNLSSGGESRPPRPAPPSRQMPRVSPLITCNDRFLVGTAAVAYPFGQGVPIWEYQLTAYPCRREVRAGGCPKSIGPKEYPLGRSSEFQKLAARPLIAASEGGRCHGYDIQNPSGSTSSCSRLRRAHDKRSLRGGLRFSRKVNGSD